MNRRAQALRLDSALVLIKRIRTPEDQKVERRHVGDRLQQIALLLQAEASTSGRPRRTRPTCNPVKGLVPGWAKDPKMGAKMINARVETITQKPSFKRAAAARRCVLPSDGYYEWEPRPDGKQPYFLHLNEKVLSMAGLYELWRDHDKADDDPDRWLWTATVITNPARDAAGEIHDRSPLIIPDDMLAEWLDPRITDLDRVREMLAAVPPPELQPYPVNRSVNSVRNNGPELLVPVAD